jgi:L-ascorbate metabolism protein UlaG (beta-lactamase superfamily)
MQVVTVASQTLFQVALTYLGDATQWIRIATLNNITAPWLDGLVTLTIPDVNRSAGGGVAGQ